MGSTPMSFHTKPWAVAQAMLAIAYTTLANIGYDPTITTPIATARMLSAPFLISNPWNRLIQTTVNIEEDQGTVNHDLELIIDTCLFSSHSVQGRGTHVFACLHPLYLEYLTKTRNSHEEGSNQKGKGRVKGKGTAEVGPEQGYQGGPPFICCAFQTDNLLQASPTALSKIAGWIMRLAVIITSTHSLKKGIQK
jgi:hypothetical protein